MITINRGRIVAVVAVTAALCAPLLLSDFATGLLALWLPLVILAISVDVMWGENGIVSFGHGAVFAGGGYLAGLILRGPAADTTGTNLDLLGGTGTRRTAYDTALETLHGITIGGFPVAAILIPTVACGLAGLLIGAVLFRIASVEVYAPLI